MGALFFWSDMKSEILDQLTAKELEQYAKHMGLQVIPGKSLKEKRNAIKRKRDKVKTITVLGMEISVAVKRFHDGKVTSFFESTEGKTDSDYIEMLRYIIGDEQMDSLVDACTDDDGSFDNDAMAYVMATIIYSEELKNF